MQRVMLGACVAATACGNGGAEAIHQDATVDAQDVVDAMGGPADAAPAVCGFATTVTAWLLPPGATTRAFAGFEGTDDHGRFTTVDLGGDHRPDLVFSMRFDDDSVGATRWQVHAGIDGGFAATAVDWPLPEGGPFLYPGQLPSYDLRDLDDDARPELIVTYRGGAGPVGTTRWDVYPNLGDGFAATPIAWSLPPGYPANEFRELSRWAAADCPENPAFETFDVDGDGRPDLVVTDSCAGGVATSWLVYHNDGAGFDATPSTWELPFPADAEQCEIPNRVTFEHLDLDADGRPDLVTTWSCTSDAVGESVWLVHRNTGDGFSTVEESWTLPDGAAGAMLTDVDGDERPDLVRLEDGTHWLVHHNTGDGFGAAEHWCLPDYGPGAFAEAPHAACTAWMGTPAWTLLDLDGDGARELVIADDRCDDATSTAGTSRWWVHRRP